MAIGDDKRDTLLFIVAEGGKLCMPEWWCSFHCQQWAASFV